MARRRVVAGVVAVGLTTAGGGSRVTIEDDPLFQRTYLTVTNTICADVAIFAPRGSTRSRIASLRR